ncbi:hypothetical protein [Streptomyces sp. IBSBF 2435]|uniref:hypothetical protein n=1 Tax=Streptomyces sp. IBSBF 2435 TaxID=2903531 RepID=UPI002FDC4228
MTTLALPRTIETADGWKTVDDLRAVFRALGADEDVLRRIVLRDDAEGRQYVVVVPPLAVALVAGLAELLPPEVNGR